MDQVNEGYCPKGRMKKVGWNNMTAGFAERLGVVLNRKALENRRDSLRRIFVAHTVLRRRSGGGRKKRGGFTAPQSLWNKLAKVTIHIPCVLISIHSNLIPCRIHRSQDCQEVMRLAWERPTWLMCLDDMFRHITVDPATMLATAEEGEEEEEGDEEEVAAEDDEADEGHDDGRLGNARAAKQRLREDTPNSSSSRKRRSSGPADTTDPGSKRSRTPVLSCWRSLQQGLQEHTSAVMQGLSRFVDRDTTDREEAKQCLNLAKACGIDPHSREYFSLMKLFKEPYWRGHFLECEDDEARKTWLANIDAML